MGREAATTPRAWGLKVRGCGSWSPKAFRRDPADWGTQVLEDLAGGCWCVAAQGRDPRTGTHWLAAALLSWLQGQMRLVWGPWGENQKLELEATVRVKSIL